jgi:hypothetical protein
MTLTVHRVSGGAAGNPSLCLHAQNITSKDLLDGLANRRAG